MTVHAEFFHVPLALVHEEEVPRLVDLSGGQTEGLFNFCRENGGFRCTVGQGHFIALAGACDHQGATCGNEMHLVQVRFELRQHHVCGGQRGVPTQVHFHVGGEPTEVILPRTLTDQICRLCNRIFLRNGQQEPVLWPFLQGHDTCWISAKHLVGEGIDVVQIKFHGVKVQAGHVLFLHR